MSSRSRRVVVMVVLLIAVSFTLAYADTATLVVDNVYGETQVNAMKEAKLDNYVIYAIIIIGSLLVVCITSFIASSSVMTRHIVNKLNESIYKLAENSSGQLSNTLGMFSETIISSTKQLSERVQSLLDDIKVLNAIDSKNKSQYSNLSKQLVELDNSIRELESSCARRHTDIMVSLECIKNIMDSGGGN